VRSIRRILIVGSIWAGLEAIILVLSVLHLGTVQGLTTTKPSDSLLGPSTLLFSPYSFGPVPNFPIAWLILLIALISGTVLADPGETVKATGLATFTGILAALLFVSLLGIPFPGAVSQADAQAAFFGFLASPLFLMGMVGGILGSAIGGWIVPSLRGRPW